MSSSPAIPSYIFRGHSASIHALHFFASNLRLASGDGDGWIIIWNLATKRPLGVWKGHGGGVMGLKDWDQDILISHGRDHEIRVWRLRDDDYEGMSIKLPVDGSNGDDCKWPWLLYTMAANALNYCAFALCQDPDASQGGERDALNPLLIASPNGLDTGGIDIFQLPSSKRVFKMTSDKEVQTAMVMALSMFQHPESKRLMLIAGYESGHTIVYARTDTPDGSWKWQKLLCSQPHSQPVLSVEVTPDCKYFFTSSADAVLARFCIPQEPVIQPKPDKVVNTKHAGQQDLKVRDDGKILATAGWDKRIRVYSVKTVKELAALKWHQEGCYAVAFATTTAPKLSSTTVNTALGAVRDSPLVLLKTEQNARVQNVHWLAAGGKDGKISLWDIY